jgi:hypothetical protein
VHKNCLMHNNLGHRGVHIVPQYSYWSPCFIGKNTINDNFFHFSSLPDQSFVYGRKRKREKEKHFS